MSRVKCQKGVALVLTLMILAIITAMVVEFAYGVYTSTSALYNWKDSQRLSFVAKSGMAVAAQTISIYRTQDVYSLYKYLGRQIPLENVSEGFSGRLILMAEDENSKFNLNSLRTQDAQQGFRRLLKNLGLDEGIADRVAQWIGATNNPWLQDSGESLKKDYMDSVDELLLIKGIDRQTYEKLLPYVTVYGYAGRDDKRVNVNTASIPVIMSLADISKESAKRLVSPRELEPLKDTGDLSTLFFTAGTPMNFRITAIGEENGIRRMIECVISTSAGNQVRYWRES